LIGDFPGPDEVGPGSLVAEYRIEARIGAGGMAVVHRARDERLPRLAALRVMAPQWAADEEFRQRFIAESRASTTVDHPHVIPVYKAGEADGVLFIAMRLVTGGDLRELMRREGGALPVPRALDLPSPVASGTATGKVTAALPEPDSQEVVSVAFAPGSSTILAAGDGNGSTYLWNTSAKRITATLPEPYNQGVTAVTFVPGGRGPFAGGNPDHSRRRRPGLPVGQPDRNDHRQPRRPWRWQRDLSGLGGSRLGLHAGLWRQRRYHLPLGHHEVGDRSQPRQPRRWRRDGGGVHPERHHPGHR
jgi:Protein tyrosine and serine/threonine kinase